MKVRKALFQHDEPWRFTQGRWVTENTVSKGYLIYKWLIALFLLAHQVLSIWFNFDSNQDKPDRAGKYMIFFTHWGFILITMAVTLDACLVLHRFTQQQSKHVLKRRNAVQDDGHWTVKISIGVTAIAYPLALFVTIAFWGFIYNWKEPFEWGMGNYINLNVHLIQTIVALVDTMISARPWRMWHMWCPMLLGLIYMIFNLLYIVVFDGTFDGRDYVYSVLNWNHELGQTVIFVVASFLAFPVLFSVFYFLAKFRDFLWRKYCRDEADPESVATSINRNGVYVISMKLQDASSTTQAE